MRNPLTKMEELLEEKYKVAESIVNGDTINSYQGHHIEVATEIAKVKHAVRGAAITLLCYKLVENKQDIRIHKDEYEGGFSARKYDTRVTIPFLIEKSLPRSVETHWLTQTISYAPPLTRDIILKTQPKKCGPLFIEVVNLAQEIEIKHVEDMLTSILIEMIKIRNKDTVILTKPKNLPIGKIKNLLTLHFSRKYKSNAPRLPQLAVYAIYESLLANVTRFENKKLEPIQRMKSADRKSGTIGDVVILDHNNHPVEAIEIKFNQPISDIHVCEAIEKSRGESSSRYYLLSTSGVLESDIKSINERKEKFLKQNGCEIIVDNLINTISYYLRLLPNTSEFLFNYASLVESDIDTSYEHRIAWNEICASN